MRTALSLSILALFAAGVAAQQDSARHPSLVSRVLATYEPPAPEVSSAEARVRAAQALLEALSDERRAELTFPIDSAERANWTNVPPGPDEPGLRLGDCDEAQVQRVLELLASTLSSRGYQKVRTILLADDRLLRNGEPRVGFGAENFWLLLFGQPSATEPWGLQLDGHHLALNLTFAGEQIEMSPSFLGTQPSRYDLDGVKIEPLAGEFDDGFAFVNALDDSQRELAVVSPRRGRNAAAAGKDGLVPEPRGLPCKDLDAGQRALLLALIDNHVGNLPAEVAAGRRAELEAELDSMTFAWSGPITRPGDVSYRLQGPTLIAEFACQDLGGDPLDHLHAMYRDPTNEYGARYVAGR